MDHRDGHEEREREKTKKNGTDQMAYLVGGLEHFFYFRVSWE